MILYGIEKGDQDISKFLFQILLNFGILRFSLTFSRIGRFVILSLKISFTKLGMIY